MELSASLRLDHELLAVERDHHVHCMLELTAPAMLATKREPLSVAVVIDRSGSMEGAKLETAKACAGYLARRLGSADRLSIVTYGSDVELVHPLQEVGRAGIALEHAIAGIGTDGMTNLSGGWLKGVEQLRAVPGGTGPKRVLLLTDGQANEGVTDPAQLVAMAAAAADDGVATTTIGFGEDFDEELLTSMADAGVGNAHFAATHEEAPGIFATEFEGLVSLAAQNLSVEIRPGADVEMLGVLNDAPQVSVIGGVQVQLGDAYSEERRRVVFELSVPRLEQLGLATVAHVVVRYVAVGAQIAAHELTVPVTVNAVSAQDAAGAGPDAEVTEEIVVLKAARAQDDARRRAMEGDGAGAAALLREAAQELKRAAPGSARANELTAQAEEIEGFHRRMVADPGDRTLSKQMHYRSREKKQSRKRPPQP